MLAAAWAAGMSERLTLWSRGKARAGGTDPGCDWGQNWSWGPAGVGCCEGDD